MKRPVLFLSHSSIDSVSARTLKQRIEDSPEARSRGLTVWLYEDDLKPGLSWKTQLEAAISEATAFAVYVGSKGVVNWVDAEVQLALNRAFTDPTPFPFIPILSAGVQGLSTLPGFVSLFQAVRELESNPEEFQKFLSTVLGEGQAGGLKLEANPFFGLKAIDEARSHLFFGRELETAALVRLLTKTRLLMVTGDSGSGKSSLVRAGLQSQWRGGALAEKEGGRPDEEIWHVVEMRPRGSPRRALGDAVYDTAGALGLDTKTRGALSDWAVRGDAEHVRRALRCNLDAGRTRILLVVDQFEELWALDPQERRKFLDLLLELSSPAEHAFTVVVTMRGDYANLASEHEKLWARLEADNRRSRYVLGRMSDEGLREIVTKPLKLAGIPDRDAATLANTVLLDVGQRPGDLALVQFALTETWRRRTDHDGDLVRSYLSHEVGRVEGALARAAERIYANLLLPKYSEKDIEAVFLRLVKVGDTGGATRRSARRREFDANRWSMLQLLATGKGNRLVLLTDRAGDERAEIAHEALVSQWPRFQEWLRLASDTGNKLTFESLVNRAAAWASVSEDRAKKARLATGAERENFSALILSHAHWPSEDERIFVAKSEEAEKRLRLTRLLPWGIAAGISVAIIAATQVSFPEVIDVVADWLHPPTVQGPSSVRINTNTYTRGTIYNGACDASAAVSLDNQHFVAATDDDNTLRIYRIGEALPIGTFDLSPVLKPEKKNSGKAKEVDIEGAARVGDRIYWIGSHARDSGGGKESSRHRLFATDIGRMVGAPHFILKPTPAYTELLKDLIDQLPGLKLKDASELAPEDANGFNIEGLAAAPGGELVIGLRNPRPGGTAVVVPLTNPAEVVAGSARPRFGVPERLDLGKRGIRTIDRVGDRYVIVAGPFGDGGSGEGGDFAVYTWSGPGGAAPKRETGVTLGDLRPEALFGTANAKEVYLLSDDGTKACKDQSDQNHKTFRGLAITLEK